MSWTEKRISLPFLAQNRTHSLTASQYSTRNIEEDKVLSGYLRKLKTNKRKWFVLYNASQNIPARLEYHDNERKWKSGSPPSREIILKECFNICKKKDSRDSKNKHVIAIYTLDECLSILFEEELDLQAWLIQLLNLQKGEEEDGRIPKPNFENMWQVNVKNFKPDDPVRNTFTMSGPHRLCVTLDDLKFFPNGSITPITFPIVTLRSCVCNDRFFLLYTGRSSFSGGGALSIYCEDKDISSNLNSAVHDAMEYNSQNRCRDGVLSTHQQKSLRTRDAETPTTTVPTNSSSSSSSHRPRSESCSKVDKLFTNAPKLPSTVTTHQPTPSSHLVSVFGSSSRYRTTSEGNHFELHRKKGNKSSVFSGSPMSPSPGSCVSSESAGSSNSIDDADAGMERRHTSINEPQTTTIYEESSAESWVDPSVNKHISEDSPPYSHMRTCSDNGVHYVPIEVGPGINNNNRNVNDSNSIVNSSTTHSSNTNYASIVNQSSIPKSSDYMVMTPSSGNTSSTSSLKRHSSLDQPSIGSAEQRRLAILGLSEEAMRGVPAVSSSTATITSPSSQSSYNPLDDVEEQPEKSVFSVMSPLSSVSKSIPIRKQISNSSNSNSNNNNNGKDEDEYMSMSPASNVIQQQNKQNNATSILAGTSVMKPRQNMAIPLDKSSDKGQEYEVMSPVSLDPEKLRRISEEDPSPAPLSAIEEKLNSGHGTPVTASSFIDSVRSRSSRNRGGSNRTSFCSDVDDSLMQLQQNHPAIHSVAEKLQEENTDYLIMDYSKTPASSSVTESILIPSTALSSSPASSGTPNSLDTSRFPPDFHFETKAVSYLRPDDRDVVATSSPSTNPKSSSNVSHMPLRAYSVSSTNRTATSSNSSLSGRSRTSSITSSRFMEIPGGKSKLSPNVFGKAGSGEESATKLGQSPNLISRLDNWFRSRTGSVPSRPALNQRRRHRTQSEGEKDSPENQEASTNIVSHDEENSNTTIVNSRSGRT